MFRIKLFGSPHLQGHDGPLTGRPVQRHRLALLALLAIARERGLTRDRLSGFLWPDANPDRARRLLSDSVYRINRAVAGEALLATGDDLRLNPFLLPCDVWEFAEAFERREWQRAVELSVAPFMDGFLLKEADELERWVDGQRERLSRERAFALEALADAADRDGALDDAVRWLRVSAAQDPYSSRIALRLMRTLDRQGDRAAALQHARVHAAVLAQEMGLTPDPEFIEFVDKLRAGPQPLAKTIALSGWSNGAVSFEIPAQQQARTNPQCVAVLPFVNLTADPENEYFADGITEDVIAHLSKVGALRVISRTSVMMFKKRDHSLREIGAALSAGTVVEGSVRRAADRVRIVAQLVDPASGQCLWAETYDRRLTDVFAIQTDVALHIAEALRAKLSADENTRIRKEPTHNLEAYQLYLKGRHCFVRFTDEGMRQGVAFFERALALDPAYALGHARIAQAYSELGETGSIRPSEAYRRATKAVAAALELDGELGEAHCVAGHLKCVYEFDWVGAEREFQRSLVLSPSSADTYDLYGRLCAGLERYDEAIALTKRAHELDPLAHRSDLASTLLRAGRLDEALDLAQRAVEFEPYYARAHATLGWAYLLKGLQAEGVAELEKVVELARDDTAWLAQLGQAYAQIGRVAQARQVLQQLEELSAQRYVSPYHMAYVHTGLGDHELAIDWLERACAERAGAVYGVKGSFLFASLRSHPRFTALIERMNLAR